MLVHLRVHGQLRSPSIGCASEKLGLQKAAPGTWDSFIVKGCLISVGSFQAEPSIFGIFSVGLAKALYEGSTMLVTVEV